MIKTYSWLTHDPIDNGYYFMGEHGNQAKLVYVEIRPSSTVVRGGLNLGWTKTWEYNLQELTNYMFMGPIELPDLIYSMVYNQIDPDIDILTLLNHVQYPMDNMYEYIDVNLTHIILKHGKMVLSQIKDVILTEKNYIAWWKIAEVLMSLSRIADDVQLRPEIKTLLLSLIDNEWVAIRDGALCGLLELDDADLPVERIEQAYAAESNNTLQITFERLLERMGIYK